MFGGMRERNGVRRYILPPLYPGPPCGIFVFCLPKAGRFRAAGIINRPIASAWPGSAGSLIPLPYPGRYMIVD